MMQRLVNPLVSIAVAAIVLPGSSPGAAAGGPIGGARPERDEKGITAEPPGGDDPRSER